MFGKGKVVQSLVSKQYQSSYQHKFKGSLIIIDNKILKVHEQ